MSKKGFVYSNSDPLISQKIIALNSNWYYNWGPNMSNIQKNIPFTPMIWSDKTLIANTTPNLSILNLSNIDNSLLGFNEPDNTSQSNMTVDQAAKLWPQLRSTKRRLGSPATYTNPNNPNSWLYQFMILINNDVDFITVHWYAPPNPKSLLNEIDTLYNTYNKPIWITEFSPADWNATLITPTKYTQQDAINFMDTIIPQLNSRSYVERFAWKTRSTSDPHMGFAALFNDDGSLTSVGEAYSKF